MQMLDQHEGDRRELTREWSLRHGQACLNDLARHRSGETCANRVCPHNCQDTIGSPAVRTLPADRTKARHRSDHGVLREHPFRRVSMDSLTSGNVRYLWENHPAIEPGM